MVGQRGRLRPPQQRSAGRYVSQRGAGGGLDCAGRRRAASYGAIGPDVAIDEMVAVVGMARRGRRNGTGDRGGCGMTSRWRSGRRAGIALLAVLVLLVLHHPAMGAMSMTSLSGHGAPMALMAPGHVQVGSPGAAARPRLACPAFLDVCPMHVVVRSRLTLLLPPSPAQTPLSWASGVVRDARLSTIGVIGVERYAPTARARRAILQVFLF